MGAAFIGGGGGCCCCRRFWNTIEPKCFNVCVYIYESATLGMIMKQTKLMDLRTIPYHDIMIVDSFGNFP